MSWASILFVLLSSATFAAAEVKSPGVAVIPPGREELLADMLGLGAELPLCAFAGAQADRAIVRSRYACPAGEVVIELRHPSNAPESAIVTTRFAIVSSGGAAPPELLNALEARIRARESGFEWTWTAGSDPDSPPEFFTQITHAGALTIFALLPVAVVGAALLYWMRRRTKHLESARSRGVAVVASAVGTLVVCACVHAALRVTGRSFAVMVRNGPAAAVLTDAGLVGLLVAAATITTALLVRVASTRARRAWAAALIIAYVVIGWRWSLLPADLHYFGTLSTLPPNTTVGESGVRDSPLSYRINRLGFRQPDFDEEKPAGVLRVILIGDSFVFGIGVDHDSTLPYHLAAELERRFPSERFQVLNLGIPGNNLASHVELYSTATARLHPDAVVLCLTLVNDLSRWDEQVAREDARRWSAFSLVRSLAGDGAEALWPLLFLERSTTPAGLEHLDRQLSRLERIRRQSAQPPVLVLFGFSPWETPVAARLEEMPDVVLVPNRTTLPEEFIAGDGHPTSIGNRRSAAHIAGALERDASWRRLVAAR
jgi:hypothetical protein